MQETFDSAYLAVFAPSEGEIETKGDDILSHWSMFFGPNIRRENPISFCR